MESAAPLPEPSAPEPGTTVHVRGTLAVLESSCAELINELLLRGRALPDVGADALLALPELDELVARSERETCGSMLGLRSGGVEYALEAPFERVWKQYDAELFDELLGQIDAVVFGVVEAVSGKQVMVRVDRVCRGAGPALVRPRPEDAGHRWPLLDGLEHLATLSTFPRTRRAQALRVVFDLTVARDPARARRAAEQLANEFGERQRLEWLSARH
jgi:hypothetical protein